MDAFPRECYRSYGADDLTKPIILTQTGLSAFTITYGTQVKSGLTYTQAETALGAALMDRLTRDEEIVMYPTREVAEAPKTTETATSRQDAEDLRDFREETDEVAYEVVSHAGTFYVIPKND